MEGGEAEVGIYGSKFEMVCGPKRLKTGILVSKWECGDRASNKDRIC